MNNKKKLQEQYKARKVVGGIYRLVNTRNGRFILQDTDDMQSAHNHLSFSKSTNSCVLPPLQEDWRQYGGTAFELEELERLEKKPEQSIREFQEDLKVLLEYWNEELPKENRY